MKRIIYILFLFLFIGCTAQEDLKLTYEIFTNHPEFTVSYITYTGKLVTVDINSLHWKRTIPMEYGDQIKLEVKGDSIQMIQASITFDSKLLIEENKYDTLPEIEINLKL